MSRLKPFLPVLLVLLAVCIAYSNHFHNGFHFDDAHTVLDNPWIRSLHNVPRFFTDATTFSVLPSNRTYRPLVSTSLALDYALGRGYKPFWFHVSTFLVFLAQLVGIYALFVSIGKAARSDLGTPVSNRVIALLATAWYGLHPAMAETVNYIIQRGDVFCACGVVAALAIFAQFPAWRRTGVYLLPFAFALLSKPPAIVFPVLLFLYLILFEEEGRDRYLRALVSSIPSVAVCCGLMVLQSAMTPKTYAPSILSASAYRITQPFALMRYFGAFFLPIHLNVDTDLQAFSSMNGKALLGFVFVAVLIVGGGFTIRNRVTRPIAFGLFWFLITSLPTSLYTLSEVENDHRMFLPFVGLVLAVTWSIALAADSARIRLKNPVMFVRSSVCASLLILALYAYGTYQRNQVWRTDESLWFDDVQKSPQNGRGLMNYGLTQMSKGAFAVAVGYFQRALLFTPNYPTLEINLGIAHAALHHNAEAAQHFVRAIALAPTDDEAHYFYARWLYQAGNVADTVRELELAVRLNSSRLQARDLLADAYAVEGNREKARAVAQETLRIAPADAEAARILSHPITPTADFWINASLYQYQSRNYQGCVAAAREALKLKPDSAIANANLGAGYAGLQQWPRAIHSERDALRIDPNFTLAKNNLALYTRLSSTTAEPILHSPEDWLNASLRDNQAGQYQKSIDDARTALRHRPDYAEAYNNIAAAYAAMGNWDQAIAAAGQALRLKPDFQLAKNNLAWAQSQKRLQSH